MPDRRLPAIPTLYNGVSYRSRLEAKWAAFFERLHWPFEYEAIDLNGYIPDFILATGPTAVECKPITTFDEDAVEVCARIDRGGWEGDALLVGAMLWPEHEPFTPARIELIDNMFEVQQPSGHIEHRTALRIGRMREGKAPWTDAYLACVQCDEPIEVDGTYTRFIWYVTPIRYGLTSEQFFGARVMWADAGNVTQWKPTKREPTLTKESRALRVMAGMSQTVISCDKCFTLHGAFESCPL